MTTDEHYIVSPDKHLIQFDYAEQTVTLVDIKVNNDTAIDNKLIYGSVKGLKLDEDGKPVVGSLKIVKTSTDGYILAEDVTVTI